MTLLPPKAAGLAGIAAAIGLAFVAVAAPRAAAAGWLIAFVSIAALSFGSLALLLIHALTGGRWGDGARPALVRASALVPLLAVFFLVLLAAADAVYPWAGHAAAAGPGVAARYLNIGFFAGRGIVFITGLAVLAFLVQRGRLRPLAAGLGLVWYGVGMDLITVDWLSSLDPRYTSSAFGVQIIVSQFAAALAWAILATEAPPDGTWPDLAALLLATVLGESYLLLMTFIIDWYGDQPKQAAWYLQRTQGGWLWLELAGILFGLGPMIALLFADMRRSPVALKGIALATLLGVFIENVWLVAPQTGALSASAGLLATIAAGGLAAGAVALLPRARREARHGV